MALKRSGKSPGSREIRHHPLKYFDNPERMPYFIRPGRQIYRFGTNTLRENNMKGTWVKVVALVVALTLCGAGMAFAAKAKKAEFDVAKALIDSYTLIETQKYAKAQKLLEQVLAKDPGNPLALNNLAAVMVAEKKFDKADTLLKQALPKAKGYMIQVNRVCTVGNICMAFKPVAGGTGNMDLEAQIKMNIEMVKGMMTASPIPGKGLR
jgi:tetratricopeptide (TPR) repeat protein